LFWPGISAYQVETSIDNAPFTIAQSLPDGSYGYDFSIAGIAADTICFRISAVRQGDNVQSASNVICFPFDQTRPTTFNYLRNVSVNTAGRVELEWYADSTADITSFRIERSSGAGFATTGTMAVSTPAFLNAFTDTSAATATSSYTYRVISFDACDSLPSSQGKTILLRGTNSGTANNLSWTAFQLDHATVLSYTVYLVQNGNLIPDTTVSPSVLSYSDYVASDISADGSFCYVVEASFQLDLPGGLLSETLQSRSNIV
jgi:hypothetical protein